MRNKKVKVLRKLALVAFTESKKKKNDQNLFFPSFFRKVKRSYQQLDHKAKTNITVNAK